MSTPNTVSDSKFPGTTALPADEAARRRTGLFLGCGSYFIWGFMPIVFNAAKPATSFEVLAHRIVWSLVFCAVLLAVTRGYRELFRACRDQKLFWTLAAASVAVCCNWLLFLIGSMTGNVLEISLGYFINPLISVLLGVVFLGEKLRPLQWTAIGIGVVAVLIISFGYGKVPWLGLGVAFSFGLYGLIKNKVGGKVGSLQGLTIETAVLTPFALAFIGFLLATGQSHFGTVSGWTTFIMLMLGPVTAIPLIMFSGAASRVPLSWVGMMQYIAPTLQFIFGVTLFHEHMALTRWIGFFVVWIAVIVITTDGMLAARRSHVAAHATAQNQ